MSNGLIRSFTQGWVSCSGTCLYIIEPTKQIHQQLEARARECIWTPATDPRTSDLSEIILIVTTMPRLSRLKWLRCITLTNQIFLELLRFIKNSLEAFKKKKRVRGLGVKLLLKPNQVLCKVLCTVTLQNIQEATNADLKLQWRQRFGWGEPSLVM